ncbi:MAG: diguanylate cyclase [Pseudomonadota bacterium]
MLPFFSKVYKSFHWNLKSIVTLGFALVLVLMILLALTGLSQMFQNNARMEHVLNEQNTKTALISSMRNIARDRIVLLFTVITLSDPFKRDDAISRLRQLANDFISLRMQFAATGLNTGELNQFSRILDATRVAAASQAQVIDLINNNKLPDAQQQLVKIAVPEQNHVIDAYDQFLKVQTNKSKDSIDEAKRANHDTYFTMIMLVAAALALSTMVAMFVIRRISRIEDALFEEKELAEITLHSVAEGIITTDKSGNVTYLNPVAEQLTGWQADKVKDKNLDEIYNIINETTKLPFSNILLLSRLDGPTVPLGNRALIRQDGHQFAIQDSIAPIRNQEGNIVGAVVVFNDVSEARNLTQTLTWQACHDALTGLSNRREFEGKLSYLLDSAQNQDKEHFLLFMDLDKFKLINDTCGHIAGDELLRQLSRTLETTIRGNDTLARLGGDEFGILLECCPLKHALEIAENIRKLIASLKFTWDGKSFQIGVSIGLIPINSQSGKEIEIMRMADVACYKAKNDSRNHIQLFEV